MKRLASFFLMTALAATVAASEVEVRLDFGRQVIQIEGPDGASVCQFHGSDYAKQTIHSARSYGTLGGFPNDDSGTEFGRFCDVAFSTRGSQGMGLSQVWSTPNPFQTPKGALGKKYSAEAWAKLDFSMYLPGLLNPERFIGHGKEPARGHTVPMLAAALKRARRENQRILFWNDLHTDYPLWMWKDGLRKNPIPEELWEEAALHMVYYTKYLTAVHGVPVHTVSFQNEPDLGSRHAFTPEMLIRVSKLLREKLDEAGLHGVRVMPYTSVVLGIQEVPWMKKTLRTLADTYELLEGPYKHYQQYIDSVGGHLSHGDTPLVPKLRNLKFWRASGDFDSHWAPMESVTFNMGPDDQIDEVIRLNTWVYGKGASLSGIWQVALRMGHTVDDFLLPEKFDIEKTFRHQAIDGAATVYPYLRPGMFLVGGSQGHEARAQYSVDGFGGRGKPEVVVITNSGEERGFRIRMANAERLREVEVFQSTASTRKQSLGRRTVEKGQVSIRVPADSVTSLVATQASTRPMLVMVVKDAGRMTTREAAFARELRKSYDVEVVSQALTDAEQDRFASKRHPVDPMGAAWYLLSDSIDRRETAYAYRAVMAPVVAMGRMNAYALGVRAGSVIAGGAALAFRDPLDPPAAMLEGGLPKACGARAGWDGKGSVSELRGLLERMK